MTKEDQGNAPASSEDIVVVKIGRERREKEWIIPKRVSRVAKKATQDIGNIDVADGGLAQNRFAELDMLCNSIHDPATDDLIPKGNQAITLQHCCSSSVQRIASTKSTSGQAAMRNENNLLYMSPLWLSGLTPCPIAYVFLPITSLITYH